MAFCITTLVTYKNGYFLNKIIKFFTNIQWVRVLVTVGKGQTKGDYAVEFKDKERVSYNYSELKKK